MARVLVADDDALVLSLVADYLEAAGHQVLRAEDGIQARSLLENGVEILITDLHMPGLDGFGVIEHARSLAPPVPAIMISATWTAEERVVAAGKGIARLHDKPVDLAVLARDVDELT